MVKGGTPPTLVESQGSRKSGSEEGTDKDAAWSRSHYGYKMHIGVDEGSGLIRKAVDASECQRYGSGGRVDIRG